MERPVVIIAVLYMAGLVLGVTFPGLGGWTALLVGVVCLTSLYTALRRREVDAGSRMTLICVLALGTWQGARVEQQWERAQAVLQPLHEGLVVSVRGRLARQPRIARATITLALDPAEVSSRGAGKLAPVLPIELQLMRDDVGQVDVHWLALGDMIAAEGVFSNEPRARNPGGFDRQAWQWQRGVGGLVTVTFGDAVQVTPGDPTLWARYLRWARNFTQRVCTVIDQQQGTEAGGFSRALLLGDRTGLDAYDRQAFVATGLGHLFAV